MENLDFKENLTLSIELYFEEKGEGFPLILLHGNGESHEYFTHQIEHFSKYYRVLAPDTRGHGSSPRGISPFTLRTFADDLCYFMEERGIEKAHILGFSDGGNIAMCFALKYPKMVAKLVLNGANLSPSGVKASVQIPITLGYKIASRSSHKSHKAAENAEMLGLMVNEPNLTPEDLARIESPTLVIAGKKDMIKENHTRLIHASLKNSELAIIRGDHFIANKNPDVFNSVVERFLAE